MEEEPHHHHHYYHDHDYNHQHSPLKSPSSPTSTTNTTTATITCYNCGTPTSYTPPPAWSDTSPPPNYRPICTPAINLPPSSHTQQAIILAPVLHSQKVPLVSPPYHFQTPAKKIQSPEDINHFQNSNSSKNFLGFVVALSESIRSPKLSDPCHQSETINSIISILETLIQWINEIPLAQQSARYDNLSYRTWHNRLTETSDSQMLQFLPASLQSDMIEIIPYFTDSFRNSSQIDYGTSHKTNFAAWLYCLAQLRVIKEEDYHAVVARVFMNYLELIRKLQLVYCLEPAGSRGVWGLDDYHFLPFI